MKEERKTEDEERGGEKMGRSRMRKCRSVQWRQTVLPCSRQGVSLQPPESLLPFKRRGRCNCVLDLPTPTDLTAKLISYLSP